MNYLLRPDKYLSSNEVTTLLNAVDAEYLRELNKPRQGKAKTWEFRRLLLYTAFLTGARSIELTRMKIKDIDIKNGQLTIHSAKKRKAIDEVIWIEDRLIPILKKYTSLPGDSYLFGGNKQLSTSCLQRAFKESLKLVQTEKDIKSLHSTRHSYGVYYWQETKDRLAVQWQLRLSSVAMVSVYCQPTPEAMRDYAARPKYKQNKPRIFNKSANNVTELELDRDIA